MYRTTPAGEERERLTGLILDYHDQDEAVLQATRMVGARTTREIQDKMRVNACKAGLRDYLAYLSVTQLQKLAKKLK